MVRQLARASLNLRAGCCLAKQSPTLDHSGGSRNGGRGEYLPPVLPIVATLIPVGGQPKEFTMIPIDEAADSLRGEGGGVMRIVSVNAGGGILPNQTETNRMKDKLATCVDWLNEGAVCVCLQDLGEGFNAGKTSRRPS